MEPNQLTQLTVALITLIITNIFTLVKQHMDRRATLEERRQDLEERKQQAAELFARHDVARVNAEALKSMVAENTVLTAQAGEKAELAYSEANHVNLKISDLNSRLLEREAIRLDGLERRKLDQELKGQKLEEEGGGKGA